MKILFFLGFPNPFPRAGWTRIGFFAEDWSRKGHSVEVLGTFSYRTLRKRGVKKMDNFNIFNLVFNMSSSHPLVFTLNGIISFIVSTFFLLAKKPSVAVVSVPSGDAGLGALMACKLLKANCVVDYRDEWEDYTTSLTNQKTVKLFYSIIRKIAACLYVRSRLVVAATPNFATSLKLRGVTDVRLVWNGADTRAFKPLGNDRKNQSFTVFYSGVVGRYYKLDIVVRSMKNLVDKGAENIKLIIAGSGEAQKVLNLAFEMGVSSNIEYKGVISEKAKLAKLIAEADVGLIPYDGNPLWKNSLPAKFFEYCACGIPVVATVYEDSILATFIRKYGIGGTSPPTNERKLAEAIYKIHRDKSFRIAAGKRARALIEENFDRTKVAEFFLKLIEAILR